MLEKDYYLNSRRGQYREYLIRKKIEKTLRLSWVERADLLIGLAILVFVLALLKTLCSKIT